jgi:hypothetical protein
MSARCGCSTDLALRTNRNVPQACACSVTQVSAGSAAARGSCVRGWPPAPGTASRGARQRCRRSRRRAPDPPRAPGRLTRCALASSRPSRVRRPRSSRSVSRSQHRRTTREGEYRINPVLPSECRESTKPGSSPPEGSTSALASLAHMSAPQAVCEASGPPEGSKCGSEPSSSRTPRMANPAGQCSRCSSGRWREIRRRSPHAPRAR